MVKHRGLLVLVPFCIVAVAVCGAAGGGGKAKVNHSPGLMWKVLGSLPAP